MSTDPMLKLDDRDNVAVALADLQPVEGGLAAEHIPSGHKIALTAISAGAPIVKYGQPIGVASRPIAAGTHVHDHNCSMAAPGAPMAASHAPAPLEAPERRSFMGYRRPNGRFGTRNYIGVIATVNCSTTVCRAIAETAARRYGPTHPHIDGFVPIIHDQGCGMAAAGEGFDVLMRTLKGYRDHPNFGGVLLVGLGCEVNQLTLYRRDDWHQKRFYSVNIQDTGGSAAAVEMAVEMLAPIAAAANRDRRQACDVSGLVLGMQCGGSDAFSGLTANPALGIASDMLVAAGGASILSETPEIYGAEHLLINRADAATGTRIGAMVAWWRDYAASGGAVLDNNPSPGNKRGGLTTIAEKSLGAVAKAGSAPLSAAIAYAEPAPGPGLIFMDSPGYDPVAATGQVASGANLIAFTTGRGSCFGAKPVPSIKLTSNSAVFRSMEDDMDIDCGTALDGQRTLPSLGAEIYQRLLDVASGERTKSEQFGYGDLEFVPWKLGPVL